MPRVVLLVGTRKGTFFLESENRATWSVRGPMCEAWPILDVTHDPSDGAILAGGGSPWFGPAVWRTEDLGSTWTHSSAGLTYGDDGPAVTRVWNVTPADGVLYAGVEPAGLFRSEDGGRTWTHVVGLREHPSRPEWQPGAGGLILHTIVPDPTDDRHLWVGISSVGVFETTDGGATWTTRNTGVRAGFMPDNVYPEFGQCVHKFVMAAGEPRTLYQQNHCGMYRSDDAGSTWTEVTGELPTDFGFSIAAHPRDPDTAWIMPLTPPEQGRYAIDGRPAVFRTRDRGASWTRLSSGLPSRDAYITVLREAMAVDSLDPAGVYVGTETGEVFGSADEGETWTMVASHLPPIASVDAAVLPG